MSSDIVAALKGLSLHGMASAWPEVLGTARIKTLDHETVLHQLLKAEAAQREVRSMAYQMRVARFQSAKAHSSSGGGVLLLLVAGSILLLAPKAWLLAVIFGGWALSLLKTKAAPQIDGARYRSEFVSAQTQWYRELDGWRKRVGLSDLEALREQLRAAKQRYIELAGEEQRQVEEYRSKRRERQLHFYLEGFDLSRAAIKGIGPAKLAALSSYGVDTAADISNARLLTVPGFGEALSSRLQAWRAKHEARFVYNASENDADRREIARIRALRESKAAPLRTALASGAQELELKARRVQDFAQKEDPLLAKVHTDVERAKTDLTFLGLPIPSVTPPAQPRQSTAPPLTPSYRATGRVTASPSQPNRVPAVKLPSHTSNPSCPLCSGQMRQRLARRGRNAGSYFWGCSRFPSCKGTRPI